MSLRTVHRWCIISEFLTKAFSNVKFEGLTIVSITQRFLCVAKRGGRERGQYLRIDTFPSPLQDFSSSSLPPLDTLFVLFPSPLEDTPPVPLA